MMKTEQNNGSKRRRVGLFTVLLITLLCLIPIRIFILGTYLVDKHACTSPVFSPNSLLIVNYTKAPHRAGERMIFSYSDSLRQQRLAPAEVVEYRSGKGDSLIIQSCSDTIIIPRTAVKGKVVSAIKL